METRIVDTAYQGDDIRSIKTLPKRIDANVACLPLFFHAHLMLKGDCIEVVDSTTITTMDSTSRYS